MKFDQYSIRLIEFSDLPAYFKLIDENRERLETFFAGTTAITRTLEETEIHLKDIINRNKDKNYFSFVVTDQSTGNLVASIQVKSLDWNVPKAELGYYIDRKYEGKGITTKALTKIIRFCFDDLQLNKLYIRTHEENISSRKVAERNGFTLEGTIRKDYMTTDGRLVDLMYYGLVREGE